jgi:glutamate transport system permease protein
MSSVLFDLPGPQTKRRILVASVIVAIGLAVVGFFVVRRLADQDQFSAEKWGPIVDPSNPQFDDLWRFLGGGLKNTLIAASWAMFFSLTIGTIFAVTRITAARWYRWLVVSMIEVLRGVPVVMAIFFAARVLPEIGVDLSLLWYVVIGLTAYNSVVIGEIIRAGVRALPKGQTEAAYAIGLTRMQTLRLILLPQALRIMLPALISQLVVIVKDTSLAAFVSYEELLRRGNIAVQSLHNPIPMLLTIAVIYVLINYMLSRIAQYAEARLSRRRALEAPILAAERESTVAVGD